MAVRTFQQYDAFVTGTKIGHVADYSIKLSTITNALSSVRGHIVRMPLNYMKDAKLETSSLEVNELTRMPSTGFTDNQEPSILDNF
jgi:phospholipase D1/2